VELGGLAVLVLVAAVVAVVGVGLGMLAAPRVERLLNDDDEGPGDRDDGADGDADRDARS
jgi:hypothetical protein